MVNKPDDIYTPLERAKEEIWRRWNNQELKNEVVKYIGKVPKVFSQEPVACLFRNIMTPDYECKAFLELSQQINLKPVVLEYPDDKFVSMNPDKLGLAKMAFFHGWNKNGEIKFQYRCVIDCTANDGKNFNKIKTHWNEKLIDFHHRLFSLVGMEIEKHDLSSWCKINGKSAIAFYQISLALFICHGVLFEDFITNEEKEEEFFRLVVYPAFKKITGTFGLKPLIVSLLTAKTPSIDKYWFCYSEEIEQEVIRCLNGKAIRSK